MVKSADKRFILLSSSSSEENDLRNLVDQGLVEDIRSNDGEIGPRFSPLVCAPRLFKPYNHPEGAWLFVMVV